jgi:hypothetical protein
VKKEREPHNTAVSRLRRSLYSTGNYTVTIHPYPSRNRQVRAVYETAAFQYGGAVFRIIRYKSYNRGPITSTTPQTSDLSSNLAALLFDASARA